LETQIEIGSESQVTDESSAGSCPQTYTEGTSARPFQPWGRLPGLSVREIRALNGDLREVTHSMLPGEWYHRTTTGVSFRYEFRSPDMTFRDGGALCLWSSRVSGGRQ
jgi:hypothetical protein